MNTEETYKKKYKEVAALAALNAAAFLAASNTAAAASFPLISGDNEPARRNFHPFRPRMQWNEFCEKNRNHKDFMRLIRMSPDSFDKLISFVRNDLEVDEAQAARRGGAIIPEI